MAAFEVSIVQIGDVHFPYPHTKTSLIDWKDRHLRPELVKKAAPTKLQAVVRAIQKELDRGHGDAMVLVGDLTTFGSVKDFKECVEFVVGALYTARPLEGKPERFRILPGNHDLRRKVAMEMTNDERFKEFQDVIGDAGLMPFPLDDIHSQEIGELRRGRASLWFANSCVGCGDLRRLI